MVLQSGLYKALARRALKGRWQTAMLVFFTAGILITAAQVYQAIANNDVLNLMEQLLQSGYPTEYVMNQITSPSYWLPTIALMAAALLSAGLNLGMQRYFIGIVKNENAPYTTVFSKMGSFFKAVLLQILVALVLLGIMAVVLVPILLLVVNVPSLMESGFFTFIIAIAPVAMVVFILVIYFNFVLAEYALAEDTSLSPIEAMKKSCQGMKGHKMEFFVLQLSFIGWTLLRTIVSYTLQSMFGTVVGMTLSLFVSLAISVYMAGANAAFYAVRSNGISIYPQAQTPEE